ncbi:hypothetical protein [Streptomyces sp. URMC 125]|uniref:hypothetical protein n=1 Tax=Streptomyces sp. URMC 125 TaxID=3423419 RepID=UPI003F1BF2D2
MPVPQIPGGVRGAPAGADVPEVAEFAAALTALTDALDPATGWYGVFVRRDPEGLAACLAGRRLPPWDVVASLLDDLTARCGPRRARPRAAWLRALHRVAVAAYDEAADDPGGLRARLEEMLREQRHAAHREQALARALARALAAGPVPGGADRLATGLAWARDDRARAAARCRELRERLAVLESRRAGDGERLPDTAGPAPAGPGAGPPREAGHRPAPPRPRPRGARFAGAEEGPGAPGHRAAGPGPRDGEEAVRARRECDALVARLAGLRARGRTGEAHALLCEAAHLPARRLPVLVARLEDAGVADDVATLLWEAASLPPAPLAAAAGALAAAGRGEECGRLLRQGAAGPAREVAATALALHGAGRGPEAVELLSAVVRARPPEEAAEVASADPAALTPLLLAAAARVSDRRRGDVERRRGDVERLLARGGTAAGR